MRASSTGYAGAIRIGTLHYSDTPSLRWAEFEDEDENEALREFDELNWSLDAHQISNEPGRWYPRYCRRQGLIESDRVDDEWTSLATGLKNLAEIVEKPVR